MSSDVKPAAVAVARAERRRKTDGTADAERDVVDARRHLIETKLRASIERALESAPPLTEEQRTRLASILAPHLAAS